MRKDLAAEIGNNIASNIVANLIGDVEDILIAEEVYDQLPGLRDTDEIEVEVRKHLDIIKSQVNLRF